MPRATTRRSWTGSTWSSPWPESCYGSACSRCAPPHPHPTPPLRCTQHPAHEHMQPRTHLESAATLAHCGIACGRGQAPHHTHPSSSARNLKAATVRPSRFWLHWLHPCPPSLGPWRRWLPPFYPPPLGTRPPVRLHTRRGCGGGSGTFHAVGRDESAVDRWLYRWWKGASR